MSHVALDFVLGLESADSLEKCFTVLACAVEKLGYDAIAYTAIPQLALSKDQSPIFLTSSDFSAEFLAHYVEANWVTDDFTVERISNGSLELMSWTHELVHGNLSEKQKNVIKTAGNEYRLRNALSIPTQSDGRLLAGASVTSDQSDWNFQMLNTENIKLLKTFVQMFHDRVFAHKHFQQRFYLPVLRQLSPNELKLIQLVVKGNPLKKSYELCGISPTRAGNILSSLYKRLEITNVSELAYVVGLHHLAET